MHLRQPRSGAGLDLSKVRRASGPLVGLGSLAAGLLALAKPSQGQDSLVPLDLQQVLNEGEQPIGIFFEAQNQIDRLYYGELFGEVAEGQQAISNEMLSSYADGAVTIEFLDGTVISMGPNSDLILDEYIYDPGTNQGKMSVNIVSGLVKFVSGDMSSESYEIATPVGVAAVRGTEIVLFVEPDGEVQAGVFDGGFSITRDGQTLASADADNPNANFLAFTIEEGGVVQGQQKGMGESFQSVRVLFSEPEIYSTFVAAYKTEQFEEAILEGCLEGTDCSELIEELVEELSENGVDLYDAQASLDFIEEKVKDSGADPNVIEAAVVKIKETSEQVEESYEPQNKPKAGDPNDAGEGDAKDEKENEDEDDDALLTDLGIGAGAGLGTTKLTGEDDKPAPPKNEAPTDISLSTFTIAEDASSLVVGRLSATDDSTSSDKMEFSILPTSLNDDHRAFAINAATQELSFVSQPDFETQSSYSITIEAKDTGGLTFQQTLTIKVLDVVERSPTVTRLKDMVVVPGDMGDGTGTLDGMPLSDFVSIVDPDGTTPSVSISGVSGLSLSAPTPSGTLSGTYDGVTRGDSGATWTVNTGTLTVLATDADGMTGTTTLEVTGNLLIGGSDVPADSTVAITGGMADDFIGYASESPSAASPLNDLAGGAGQVATLDLSGGDNLVALGSHVANYGGKLTLNDGVGSETIQIGDNLASHGGTARLDMERDGDHVVNIGDNLASDGGTFRYLDGHGRDHLTIGDNAGSAGGSLKLYMNWAGDNLVSIGKNAAQAGDLDHWGSTDVDDLTFGDSLADGGTAAIRLGTDTSADVVRFSGSVGTSGGSVQIYELNLLHDKIYLPHLNYSLLDETEGVRVSSTEGSSDAAVYDFLVRGDFSASQLSSDSLLELLTSF